MMIAAAILILVIACINFVNLTTAQSAERAKEIGIRKSLGALKRQLIIQFTGESVLVALTSMLVSLAMIQTLVPMFNFLTESAVEFSMISLIAILAAIGIVVGLVAGIYPSLYLSSVKPTAVLKGKFLQSPKGTLVRKAFTVFQLLIDGTDLCCSRNLQSASGCSK